MPDWKPAIRSRLSSLRLAPTRENEIVEELSQHLEDRWRELVAGGMPEKEAAAQALTGLRGDRLAQQLAPLRQAHVPDPVTPGLPSSRVVGDLWQDVRYAVRVLRRRPVYALLSVLTLALGVGGTAAVFGVAHGVLLSPLPYAHERELGVFWMKTDWSHQEYLYIRGRTPGFRQVALYRQRDSMLRVGAGAPRLVPGVTASAELNYEDGRLLRFAVVAHDGDGRLIGEGEVTRVIVDAERFMGRL